MSLHQTLPHWFLLVIIIVVAIFVFKKLIKFALFVGAIGLLVYLLWVLRVHERIFSLSLQWG